MGIYNRTNNLPEEVSSLQNSINEIKQAQIIGNDNLKVYDTQAQISGQTLITNVTAIFKFTFTFNEASTSYVLPRFSTFNQTSSFNAVFYADPATVNDITKKSWFYSITTTSTVNNVIFSFRPQSTTIGTASIVRTV